MTKILITGGAGYIGSLLTKKFLDNNFKVTVYDNFLYQQSSLVEHCKNKNFEIVNADVRDFNILKPLLKENDVIIPLAALVGAPICKKDPKGSEDINKNSIVELLHYLSKNQLLIMPTTNSFYGGGLGGVECDENSPLTPISKYAEDKVFVEKKILERENSVSLRLATVFGMSPRMRFDLLVNDFVYRAVHDGFIVLFEAHFKRNFIHISDVCDCFLHTLKNFNKMKSNIYNVGLSSANLSKKELCEKIANFIKNFAVIESEISQDIDKRNYIVSNKKLEKTGFKPLTSLEQGIEELIKGCKILKRNQYSNI
jgi:nucleoside-diphosphate-sugar epimerase